MIINFTIFPVGRGESLSGSVAEIFEIIESSGLEYEHHAMGTNIEEEWEQIIEVVNRCRLKMMEGNSRIYLSMTIDERAGKMGRLGEKVESAKAKMGL